MKNLKTIREKQRKTQINVAINVGVAQEMISSYENGHSYPSAEVLIAMAKYLNTSTDYLLDLTDDPTPVKLFNRSNLNSEEIEFLTRFEKLAVEDQLKLIGYMDALDKINN